MPSRAELNSRGRNVGLNPANYPNDSAFEQEVLYAEKNATTVTGALATGTLTSDATAPSNNDTVTIGSRTYTYKTTLSTGPAVANEVLIGANAAAALANLKKAINDSGTQGTEYSYGTSAHPDVTAGTLTATTLAVDARRKQVSNTATTEASTHLSWGAATLASGLPGVVAAPAGTNEQLAGEYRYV